MGTIDDWTCALWIGAGRRFFDLGAVGRPTMSGNIISYRRHLDRLF